MAKNELAKPPTKKLTKKQLHQIASFTDPAAILTILAKADWTIEKAIENLVKLAADSDKDATKLAAIKYLNTLITDSMERAGLMVTAIRRVTQDGDEYRFTGQIVSSILQGQKETTEEDLEKGKTNGNQTTGVGPDGKDEGRKNPTKEEGRRSNTKIEEQEAEQEGRDAEIAPIPEDRDRAGISDSVATRHPEGAGKAGGQFPGIATGPPTDPTRTADYL